MAKITRTVAVLASACLVLGAGIAGPAEAGKKKKKPKPPPPPPVCAPFTPVEPQTASAEGAEALEAPVVTVGNQHTEEAPLIIEFAHGPAVWDPSGVGSFAGHPSVQEDTVFFNFQVAIDAAKPALFIRQEWPSTSPSDMDLYVYGETGTEVEHSGAFNAVAVDAVAIDLSDRGRGGLGFESIPGMVVSPCAGYTVESRAFLTAGEDMTLRLWLGDAPSA